MNFVQALDAEPRNVSMLLQRAMLYESMEKYSLGLEDLKEIMKIDPSNRNARSLMTRLNSTTGRS
jgi:regulator of sirC expression with transglutaminase-like and TPR domain